MILQAMFRTEYYPCRGRGEGYADNEAQLNKVNKGREKRGILE